MKAMDAQLDQPESKEQLFPGKISNRKTPINLREEDWAYFEHESQKQIPATFLQKEKKVFAGTCDEGVLFKNLQPLNISFPSSSFTKNFPSKSAILKAKFFLKFVWKCCFRSFGSAKHLKHAIWITDTWSGSYFHWMMDALPRLLAYQLNHHNEATLLLPENLSQMSYVVESLKAFNINDVHFTGRLTLCQDLHIPTHTAPSGNYNDELILILRDVMNSHFSVNSNLKDDDSSLIYVSRSLAKRRKISNEQQCSTLLKRYGFKTVRFEGMTLEQQVRTCRSAKVMIANHGAGLTNMLFMKPGSKVIELRKKGDQSNNCFYTLASALGLDYFYLICEAPDESENPHTSDITADCQRLEEVVTQALGHASL